MNSINLTRPNFSADKIVFKQTQNSLREKQTKKSAYIAGTSGIAIAALSFLAYKNYANIYKMRLAKDLTKELGQKITTKHLKSIMTKKEMLKLLPKLNEQNYILSRENLKNGTFLADLHSHSNHSDGRISVENLLNQAAEYGDRLNKINGKKFIFALTDHDGIDGVKEALKIIVKNPEKYKNIKFLPASEVSFIFPCQKDSERFRRFQDNVQMPEMLVYNLNPFSENTKNFFEKIYQSREGQISKAIDNMNSYYKNSSFSRLEYEKFFHFPNKKLCFLNQHWNLWNYIHTKSRVIEIAKEQNKNADELYETILNELKQAKRSINPYNLDEYIKNKNIQTKSCMINDEIKKMLVKTIFPQKVSETEVSSQHEIMLKDIINYAKKENAILGFAHPGFTMQNFNKDKCLNGMKELIKQGEGRIKFAEKFHQAYPIGKEIEENELREYNEILDKLKLINIGGRDNHKDEFIPKI